MSAPPPGKSPDHLSVVGLSAGIGCAAILVLSLLLAETRAGVVLLDRASDFFPYPFTIQNLMHLLFFVGLGELYLRHVSAEREIAVFRRGYLPEDEQTVLQSRDLGPIRRRVAADAGNDPGFLQELIDLCILQFQASRSVDQTVSVLKSSLELMSHRLDLRYQMLRYIIWVIPTIGFIGTVVGIALTLARVNPADPDLGRLTASLAVSFNTTLVALILSAVLVFLLHLVQKREETALNRAGRYALKNLVNRLYVGGSS